MIETQGLTKHYGDLAALVDLDLSINPGDIFGFIGPNGAGKTTTMRILATLLEPTRGRASIDGFDVTKDGKRVRRRVGYMPDFMGVYDDLKVFEYLEFFAAAFGIERRKRKSIVEGVLELTDLESKRSAAVDSLSRGMQQRLGLARARLQSGQYNDVIAALMPLLGTEHEAEAQYHIGYACYRLGDHAAAIQHFAAATERDPTNSQYAETLAAAREALERQ